MFTGEEILWLSESIRDIYTALNVSDFARTAMKVMDQKFRLHSFACEEIGAGLSTYAIHGFRQGTPAPADHVAYLHDNPFTPIVTSDKAPPVLHMSRQVSRADWARTDHFNGIARPMGWNDQLILVSQAKPTLVAVGLYRDAIFSDRESELLSLLQPHLAAAWKRVQPDVPSSARTAAEPARVLLSARLIPLSFSNHQHQLLRSYFPHWNNRLRLPDPLLAWAAHCQQKLAKPTMRQPLRAFNTESAHGRLLVRYFPGLNDGPIQLLLVEIPAVPDFFAMKTHGLTSRECETLHWIAQGKRDADIAAIAGVAPKTVGKHVENLLRKLRAKNRSAAVAAAHLLLQR